MGDAVVFWNVDIVGCLRRLADRGRRVAVEYTCVPIMTQEWHLRATATIHVLCNSVGKTSSFVESPSPRCSIRKLRTRVHTHSAKQAQTQADRQPIEDKAAVAAFQKNPFSSRYLRSRQARTHVYHQGGQQHHHNVIMSWTSSSSVLPSPPGQN